jgi:Mg-chelatase subunit ChlD
MNKFLKVRVCVAFMQSLTTMACDGRTRSCAINASSLLQKITQHTHSGITQRLNPKRCSLDVVLVLDTSGSVSEGSGCGGCFHQMKGAATKFVKDLQSQSTESRVALVTFANRATRLSTLSSNVNSVINEIGNIPSPNGGTNIADGLREARRLLSASPKERDQKVTLLITDGSPTVPTDDTCNQDNNFRDCVTARSQALDEATKLKTDARLTIVGVGAATHTDYMQSLVTAPTNDNFYSIANFGSLTDSFTKNLLKDLCFPCRKDTKAPCYQGLCFQRTRGTTTCNPTTNTCWCVEDDECVYDRNFSTTRGSRWAVCRKSEDDTRGEENVVKWMAAVSQDVVSTYWKVTTGSLR